MRWIWPSVVTCRPVTTVGFDREQRVADRDHAVPGAIGFEVVRFGVLHRVRLLVFAEVGDESRNAARLDAHDCIVAAVHAMRTAGAGENRIQRIADERDVGHAADERAGIHAGLAARQLLGDRGADSIRIDAGDPSAARITALVWANRRDDLLALAGR